MSKQPVLMDSSCYGAAARSSKALLFFNPVLLYNKCWGNLIKHE